MNERLIRILRAPETGEPLDLKDAEYTEHDEVESGRLVTGSGREFRVERGIPRFVQFVDEGQKQVSESFGFKWETWSKSDVGGQPRWYEEWVSQKYGFETPVRMAAWMQNREAILDAGCGCGDTAGIWLGRQGSWANYTGFDISAAVDVARERYASAQGATFVQGDALNPPFAAQTFDTVFSEGVLHHTPSTQRAIQTLAALIRPGGEFLFYVYAKKGPIREFADDHVRSTLVGLTDDEFLERMRPLTKLAQVLHENGGDVDVPEAIPYLGIPAGRQSVQRLIYWSFLKAFWNPAYSFERNNLINFDWYRPVYAHRQTPEQVRKWCEGAGLEIHHFQVEPSGITVRAMKTF